MRSVVLLCLALFLLLQPGGARAHPAPFSYVDLMLSEDRIEGTLTVHATDIAHELRIDEPRTLLDRGLHTGALDARSAAIVDLLLPRLTLRAQGGEPLPVRITRTSPSPRDADAVQLEFVVEAVPPPALTVQAHLFAFDPAHQTFVNIYEGGALAQQWLFAAGSEPQTHYAGTVAGVAAVFATFVPSGAHHVLIGPDHILFIVGLMLLGGSLRRLALIVTAFTLGHSVTLALAALDILAPPAWLIEPLIALSIVIVGVDNLLRQPGERDLRAWFAVLFGLIHGFGFAFVLREFGLPDANLAWALLAFNIGVEIGQLAIVIPLALVLAAIRARAPLVAKRIVVAGSLAVVLAGAYWFIERIVAMGSG